MDHLTEPSMQSTMLYSMIFAAVIGTFITSITQILGNLLNRIMDTLEGIDITYFLKKKYKSEIIINIRSIHSFYNNVTGDNIDYQSMVHQLNKQKINVNKIEKTYSGNRCNNNSKFDDEDPFEGFFLNDPNEICIDPKQNIYITCKSKFKNQKLKDDHISEHIYTINVHSSTLSMLDLKKTLVEWRNEYNKYIQIYDLDDQLYYFSMITKVDDKPMDKNSDYDSDDECGKSSGFKSFMSKSNSTEWIVNDFITHKNFDNIFFSDKQILMDKLDFFIKNEEYYKSFGVPYNLGLMFHGYPGCGKTSTIKAISNYTNRHVIEINLSKIKTCGEFTSLFRSEFLNGKYVPVSKRITVIEDIDCMIDLITDRSDDSKDSDKKSIDLDQLLKMKMLTGFESKKKYKNNDTDKLTLSCILNTLDGVLEQQGRILIITTNYFNTIDKALTRPGRIDLNINFTRCDNKMMVDIINYFCGCTLDSNIVFPENIYTPAEVINKCIGCKNNVGDVINYFVDC